MLSAPPRSASRRSLFSTATLLTAFVLSSFLAAASVASPVPTDEDKRITKRLVEMIEDQHISQRKLDDEIATRLFDRFFSALDPQKRYFLQADIDEFGKQKLLLDERLREGNVNFGFDVFERFLQRLDERVAAAHKFIDIEHDFTIDEDVVLDRSEGPWAQNAAELDDVWRRAMKHELLIRRAEEQFASEDEADETEGDEESAPESAPKGEAEGEEATDEAASDEEKPSIESDLHRRYRNFKKRIEQWDRTDVLEVYLTALTTSFDPHSTYFSRQALENFQISMRLELDGIGAQLTSEDGYTVVRTIIPGGAADRDGRLQAEDKIVEVAQGREGEYVNVIDMKLGDVVDKIRGKRGTVVRLKILRKGKSKRFEIGLTRDKVELAESAATSKIFEQGVDEQGEPYKVGVIDLPSFYADLRSARERDSESRSTTRDVARLLAEFKAERVDTVVVDLRRNGGGSLTEAIQMTGLFINGPVVQVKDADSGPFPYRDSDGGLTAWDGPLVVLISKGSASASEIFAGAIQDYGRGVVVGDETSHGKGSVQTLEDIGQRSILTAAEQLGALKVTRSQFYLPAGASTQNRGVVSDIVLPSWRNDADLGEANLDYALPFDQVKSAKFSKTGHVTPDLIEKVREVSEERREESTEFQELLVDLARSSELRERETRTLNQAKFFAEYKEELELSEERTEPDTEGETEVDGVPLDDSPTDPPSELDDPAEVADEEKDPADRIKKDFYLDEVLWIAVDLLKLRPSVAAK